MHGIRRLATLLAHRSRQGIWCGFACYQARGRRALAFSTSSHTRPERDLGLVTTIMVLLAWLLVPLLALVLGALALRPGCSRKHKHPDLPPGPAGLPALGNLTLFNGPRLPHHTLTELGKRYGALMFFRLGSQPCLLLNSPDACRHVFKDQDQAFNFRPQVAAARLILFYGAANLGFSHGNRWRYLRRIAVVELLSSKRIAQFEAARVQEVSAMVAAVHAAGAANCGAAIKLRPMLKALVFNFLTTVCFSKRFCVYHSADTNNGTGPDENEMNPEEAEEFTHLIDELFFLLGAQPIGDFIPYLSFLDRFSGLTARMVRTHRRFDEFLSRILETHKQRLAQQQGNCKHPDFMDILLTLPQQDVDGTPLGIKMNDNAIKSLCLDMISAGTDTSSNTLEWAMAEMVRHPDIQAKLQAEIDSVVGTQRLVAEADIPNLPYLRAFVKELFRFHPAGPLGVFHRNPQPAQVMGYHIPANTMVFTNLWGIGRDAALWDEPMEFRPERFITDRPDVDVTGHHYELLAFGTGRRQCPGMNMGLTMVQYGLARLAQAFTWSPPPGLRPLDVDIEETQGLTLPRAHPLEAVATARLPSLLYTSP